MPSSTVPRGQLSSGSLRNTAEYLCVPLAASLYHILGRVMVALARVLAKCAPSALPEVSYPWTPIALN